MQLRERVLSESVKRRNCHGIKSITGIDGVLRVEALRHPREWQVKLNGGDGGEGRSTGSEVEHHWSYRPSGDRRHDDHLMLSLPLGDNLARRVPLEPVPRASAACLCEALVGIGELGEVSFAGRGGTG